MPKIPYTENISQYNNPLPFPNYLNTLSLLTDSSTSTVRKFFNANKSISETLLITLISVIQEGIAYQLANHSNISVDNNSKSYTNNTNFYCCKGVPIKLNKKLEASSSSSTTTLKKRSSSFSYSRIYNNNDSGNNNKENTFDGEEDGVKKENSRIRTIIKNDNPIHDLKKNRLSRSFSSSSLECAKGKSSLHYTSRINKSFIKNKSIHGSRLKYHLQEDVPESFSEKSSMDKNIDTSLFSTFTTTTMPENRTKEASTPSLNMDHDSIINNEPHPSPPSSPSSSSKNKDKASVFILVKNLFHMLNIVKGLHFKKQKQPKPVESLDEKERWEEFNRIYNEAMYNLKTEEYYKNKSLIFKYCTGLNSVQGCYFDIDDNNDEMDTIAVNSMSILDEKIREKSENKKTDILSRIKKDTLTRAEIKECGEYMRRVGVYQLFIQCPINHLLRVIASKLFSCGEKKYSPILRFLFVTCVVSPIQISVNILCLAFSNKKTPSEIKKCFTQHFTHILKLSLIYVPFSSQYFARTFLPRHCWVPFFNLSSFILGTYIKLIMKKKDDRKLTLL
ncbi:hypothetical protein BCR36DRAFT_402593 [Piromyces finnis]|uniref:Uncharacterized protein n=1 Tax=Piromyces finnis TaxID=1754191 RepID=A0A1Y1VHT5_9FUNG|nr:hypothetical protein BCR36DRAFT_402593 [Piromyces finnis]|eukprot:ORX56602.1 hypothetical protein BCR36DRAFT_402593 [Piromyces finnis]